MVNESMSTIKKAIANFIPTSRHRADYANKVCMCPYFGNRTMKNSWVFREPLLRRPNEDGHRQLQEPALEEDQVTGPMLGERIRRLDTDGRAIAGGLQSSEMWFRSGINHNRRSVTTSSDSKATLQDHREFGDRRSTRQSTGKPSRECIHGIR